MVVVSNKSCCLSLNGLNLTDGLFGPGVFQYAMDKRINLQFKSRALNLDYLSVFCTFATNVKMKGPHKMSVITFRFSTVCSEAIQRPVDTHSEGESSHFVIASQTHPPESN